MSIDFEMILYVSDQIRKSISLRRGYFVKYCVAVNQKAPESEIRSIAIDLISRDKELSSLVKTLRKACRSSYFETNPEIRKILEEGLNK